MCQKQINKSHAKATHTHTHMGLCVEFVMINERCCCCCCSAPQNLMKVELFIAPAATFARTVCSVCLSVSLSVPVSCGKQKKVRTACPKNLIRRGKSWRALGITTEPSVSASAAATASICWGRRLRCHLAPLPWQVDNKIDKPRDVLTFNYTTPRHTHTH